MSPVQIHTEVLTLPTLLRINAAIGAGFGVVNAAVVALFKGQDFGLLGWIALLPGAIVFNVIALLFVTLVGYWAYRWLAMRRLLSLHHLHLRAAHPAHTAGGDLP